MFDTMLSNDPLQMYHTMLRATRASGYPNMQFLAPHPYGMAYQAMINGPQRNQFNYQIGRNMRMPLVSRIYEQGIAKNRFRNGPVQPVGHAPQMVR